MSLSTLFTRQACDSSRADRQLGPPLEARICNTSPTGFCALGIRQQFTCGHKSTARVLVTRCERGLIPETGCTARNPPPFAGREVRLCCQALPVAFPQPKKRASRAAAGTVGCCPSVLTARQKMLLATRTQSLLPVRSTALDTLGSACHARLLAVLLPGTDTANRGCHTHVLHPSLQRYAYVLQWLLRGSWLDEIVVSSARESSTEHRAIAFAVRAVLGAHDAFAGRRCFALSAARHAWAHLLVGGALLFGCGLWHGEPPLVATVAARESLIATVGVHAGPALKRWLWLATTTAACILGLDRVLWVGPAQQPVRLPVAGLAISRAVHDSLAPRAALHDLLLCAARGACGPILRLDRHDTRVKTPEPPASPACGRRSNAQVPVQNRDEKKDSSIKFNFPKPFCIGGRGGVGKRREF